MYHPYFQFTNGGTTPPIPVQPSGGYVEPRGRRRTQADIRAERIRLGIFREPKAVEAVREVAKAALDARGTALALEAQEQADVLKRLFQDRGVALEASRRLNIILQVVIEEEIRRQLQEQEDSQILMLLLTES